jgi:hypothetical protein
VSVTSRSKVIVGSDLIDIISVAMYAEPLVIFRELIQNAADSIEEAIERRFISPDDGRVLVSFDRVTRDVSMLDNGCGLSNERFVSEMVSFGASIKRSASFRGFRGIGRLAGLGHCKELVFRSKARGDRFIREARWSSELARELIARNEIVPLEELAEAVVSFRDLPDADAPAFFEVRLEGARRLADDRLFSEGRIASYLAEVAPVPFDASFSHGSRIRSELLRRAPLLELQVIVGRITVRKPYRDDIEVRAGRVARISEVEFVELPAIDEKTAAFGWVGHHDYLGALKPGSPGRGLRVRSGNLQIGDHSLLAGAFPEERFNAWAIGEFHVFDGRLRPNARRDAFEPSPHTDNLYNQLAPYAARIARRCRQASQFRNDLRRAQSVGSMLDRLEAVLRRDTTPLSSAVRGMVGKKIQARLATESPRADESRRSDVQLLKKRASLLTRRRINKRLSSRDRGRLDALEWLYDRGHFDLFIDAVVAFRKRT